MKNFLLGTVVAIVLLTGCTEDKKAPATQTPTTEVKKEETQTPTTTQTENK